MNSENTFSAKLTQFLLDDQGVPSEQVRKNLESEGVNVDGFMARVHATIRHTRQAHMKEMAQAERDLSLAVAASKSRKVLSFPIERVRQIVVDAEAGKFGGLGQELAIACRNKQDREPTEAELRALVEDILQTTDIEPAP